MWFQDLQVDLRPWLNAVLVGNRRRVLPKIEAKRPLFWAGHTSVLDLKLQLQRLVGATLKPYLDIRTIGSGLCIRGNIKRYPRRSHRFFGDIIRTHWFQNVGKEIDLREIYSFAVAFSGIVRKVGGYIANEPSSYLFLGDLAAARSEQITHLKVYLPDACSCPKQDGYVHALTSPGYTLPLESLILEARNFVPRVALIQGGERSMQPVGDGIPLRFHAGYTRFQFLCRVILNRPRFL
jgi:hypothetical protein